MGVKVRLHPPELTMGAEWECFPEATSYRILEDNTIELREKTTEGKLRVIGHVHKERWDSVRIYETEDAE